MGGQQERKKDIQQCTSEKIGSSWVQNTDRFQAGEESARGDGKRGALTEMLQ